MAAVDQVAARVELVLAEAAEAIRQRLLVLLAQLDTVDGRAENTRFNLAHVHAIAEQVRQMAEREGLAAVVAQLERTLPAVVEEALRDADLPDLADFTPRLADTLERLFAAQEREIAQVFGKAADQVARAMRRALTTGQDMAALTDEVADALDTSFGRAATAVDAATAGFSRAATTEGALAANEVLEGDEFGFVLEGPDDGRNRPFCARWVGRWVSAAELEQLDNDPGQPKPAKTFAGGYNCRHMWSPMLRSEAEAAGLVARRGPAALADTPFEIGGDRDVIVADPQAVDLRLLESMERLARGDLRRADVSRVLRTTAAPLRGLDPGKVHTPPRDYLVDSDIPEGAAEFRRDGTIAVSPVVHERARRFLSGDRSDEAIDGMQVVLHEHAHARSPIGDGGYRGVGQMIEEATNEALVQHIMAQRYGRHAVGSDYLDELLSIIRAAAPSADAEAILTRTAGRMRRTTSRAENPGDAVELFVSSVRLTPDDIEAVGDAAVFRRELRRSLLELL